jgi:hypothetical protein
MPLTQLACTYSYKQVATNFLLHDAVLMVNGGVWDGAEQTECRLYSITALRTENIYKGCMILGGGGSGGDEAKPAGRQFVHFVTIDMDAGGPWIRSCRAPVLVSGWGWPTSSVPPR